MSILGISYNFDGLLSQITFMTIHIIHVTAFCDLVDYLTIFFSITLLLFFL